MFTGIVEATGKIISIDHEGSNVHFGISAPFLSELKIDQSVAHNGVCLTVIELQNDHYVVTAIAETIRKTNLGDLKVGDEMNLERCLKADGRFDGHIVQGHVDTTACCTNVRDENGSWLFDFEFDKRSGIVVTKGSVCVNGVSLTVVTAREGAFAVAIIPYTFEHTNFNSIQVGALVNIEFDIVGKYIAAMQSK